MRTEESLTRATRLAQTQHLLHKNYRGFTTRELAALCVPVYQERDRSQQVELQFEKPLQLMSPSKSSHEAN